ncbi:hypothetical protein [Lysobacter capsici]|uniref:hypothetical protein n=1 Tax=Lysobacter capsici TaxID=435897 RepID=UPI000716664F|nr:hypothetical protein [Lysobacter capsici]
MLPPIDFMHYVRGSNIASDQVVMARIALNVLSDPERYPVDLSEIAGMRYESQIMTRAFLAWCAIERDEWLSLPAYLCYSMIQLLPSETNQEVA